MIMGVIIFLLFHLSSLIKTISSLNFKYSEIDASIKDIIWCGTNREEVFALSEMNSVYKSEDKGLTWKKMNYIFNQKGAKELESHENMVNFNFYLDRECVEDNN